MYRRPSISIAIGVFTLIGINASPISARTNLELAHELDNYFERATAFGFSGVIFIAKSGEVILDKGYGLAVREPATPFVRDTAFDIGSVAKQFTATAILELQSKGALSINDPISKHLQDVPEDKRDITIHQLLTHTSGIRRGYGNRDEVRSRDQVVAGTLSSTLRAPPGEGFAYSNAGYNLLAAIVEIASGQTFQTYIHDLISRAGLKRTGFYGESAIWQHAAHSYYETYEFGLPVEWPFTWTAVGNGHMISTTADLYRWMQFLQSSRDDMKTALFTAHVKSDTDSFGYGYGWYVGTTARGTTLIYHDGDSRGYSTIVRHYVDEDIILIVSTNEGYVDGLGQARTIGRAIDGVLFGEYTMPPQPVLHAREDLASDVGLYALESGATFDIAFRGDRLVLEPNSQEIMNLVWYPDGDAPDFARENRISQALIEALLDGDNGAFREIVADDFDRLSWVLNDDWGWMTEEFGKPLGRTFLGTAPYPFTKRWVRTYVRLDFEKEPIIVTIGFREGELFDVTSWEETPNPGAIYLVPVEDGNLVSWNLWMHEGIELESESRGFLIHSGDNRATAERTIAGQGLPVPTAAPPKRTLVGQVLLPNGFGSRGVEVLVTVAATGNAPRVVWLLFDEEGRFAHRFQGSLTSVKITAGVGVGAAVHRIDTEELPEVNQAGQIDLGVIDLRDRLTRRHLIVRAADGKPTGDVRVAMWFAPPPVGPRGGRVELGSRQFPPVALGSEMEWLVPNEAQSIYFLVERPSGSGRGAEWRSGHQRLFGPFTSEEFPTELIMD